jgi:hypothetical protein
MAYLKNYHPEGNPEATRKARTSGFENFRQLDSF